MSIIGIDIGTLHSVMATVSRGSLHTIRNELSERQTPSLVSYTDDRRLIGDHAQAQLISNYKNTCRGIKNLLGMLYDTPSIKSASEYSLCPLTATENGLVGYQVTFKGSEITVSATRVLASLLSHLVKIAEKFLGKKSSEVVLACPGWFTDIHRSAMLAAAEIAGINCLRVFSEHTATALDYGIYRMAYFTDSQPTHVAFVSMGHSNTSVSIIGFTKEKLKVLSEASDTTLGGKAMDSVIAEFFASKFQSKTGLECMKSVKHKLKLEEQASKIKKILSANSDAFCHIECFMEDYDINEGITRKEFTEMCKEKFFSKFQTLMEKAVKLSGLSLDQINSIELVGGCTRIPWVINQIQECFQKEPSRTLSSDECVARGCALQAAMASVHYKVTDYGCNEVMNHSISLTWATIPAIPKQYISNPVNAFSSATFQTANLMPQGVSINKKHKFHFQCEGPILAYAHYSDASQLPEGTPIELGQCMIIPPKDVADVYLDVGINFHGQFKFMSAYTMKKVEGPEPSSDPQSENNTNQTEKKEINTNGESSQNEDSSSNSQNDSHISKSPQPPQYIKEDLPMKLQSYKGKYKPEQIHELKKTEISLILEDSQSERRLIKMNELESLILSSKNRVFQDLNEFTTPTEKDSLNSSLDKFEDWLYDNNQADITSIDQKIENLTNLMAPFNDRSINFHEIKKGINQLLTVSSVFEQHMTDVQGVYSHLSADTQQKLQQTFHQINNFVNNIKFVNPLSPDVDLLAQIKTLKSQSLDIQQEVLKSSKVEESSAPEATEDSNEANSPHQEKDPIDSN